MAVEILVVYKYEYSKQILDLCCPQLAIVYQIFCVPSYKFMAFWLKKYHLRTKLTLFSLLSRCTGTLVLYFYANKNMEKPLSKVEYFSKILCSTALTAQSTKKTKRSKFRLRFRVNEMYIHITLGVPIRTLNLN